MLTLRSIAAFTGLARPARAGVAAHSVVPVVAPRARGGGEEDEADLFKQAYQMEAERVELISEQLQSEYGRLGEVSEKLQKEFEGCVLDLGSVPVAPDAEAAAGIWAQAYTELRRCNEQSELKLTEMRSRLQGTLSDIEESTAAEVKRDWGPIRYKGITFKDIAFSRFATGAEGSKVYFIELEMPLGLKLEERTLTTAGSGAVRAVEVTEVLEGASAAADGRIQPGDLLRCITVPKRRMGKNQGDEDMDEVYNEGSQTKALLVIPKESSFPFERVLEEIGENQKLDGFVGMVLERPLAV